MGEFNYNSDLWNNISYITGNGLMNVIAKLSVLSTHT